MKIKNKIIALMISLIAMPTFAYSQTKYYVGAEYAKNKIDTGISNVSSRLDEEDNGYSIFFGSPINKDFDVEVSYNNFGEASLSGVTGNQFRYAGTLYEFTAAGTVKAEATSFGIAVKPKLNINKNFDLVATLGAHRWESDFTASSTNGRATLTDDGVDLFYGVGLKGNFDTFSVGLNYNIYNLDDEEVKSMGIRVSAAF
ncbi:Outer membrane protein beta-barrel domain containing protein [Candidatus Pelagibacterales bacterium]